MLGKRKGGRKEVCKGGKDGGRERRREQGKTSIHFYFRMILCFEVERSKQWKRIRNVSLNTTTLKTISLHLAPTGDTNSHCSQCWENQRHVKHGALCLNSLNSSCRITANKNYIYIYERITKDVVHILGYGDNWHSAREKVARDWYSRRSLLKEMVLESGCEMNSPYSPSMPHINPVRLISFHKWGSSSGRLSHSPRSLRWGLSDGRGFSSIPHFFCNVWVVTIMG